MGTAAVLTYVTLGRRRIDYRFVLLGAVLPDLVDGVLGLLVFEGGSTRWVAHSLLGATVVAVVILVAFRRERRLALFGIAVGWLLHLVADGMWNAPFTFLWPAFSGRFSTSPREPYSWDLLRDPLAHASTWTAELAGAAALAWFFVAFRLGDRDRRAAFLRDGRLRP
jgi:inner membrane protein